MLTVEERKKLMPGDKVLAEIEVYAVAPDGLLWVSSPDKFPYEKLYPLECISHPSAKPKYDPCRKFKKGDIVRVVDWYGRSLQDVPTDYNLWEVLTDENGECVRIMLCHKMERIRKVVAACFLELLTPVEKREPYRVEKCLSRYIVYYHDPNEDGMTGLMYEQSAFYFGPPKQYTEDEALAAAEAECDRLNKKYRKEHNNG